MFQHSARFSRSKAILERGEPWVMTNDRHDVLVIGAGLSGLYCALRAAELGAHVALVTKGSLRSSNSVHAQGGVAAAIGPDDDPELHLQDTLRVGRGLCDEDAVRVLVNDGVERIGDLQRLGVRFDLDERGRPALGLEGGHSRRRVLHVGGSATGAGIAEQLIARVQAEPRIRVLEHTAVLSLAAEDGRVGGAWALGHDELRRLDAGATVLATGGAGALYAVTTNPPWATGDGIALAWRAGARISDLEFVQFHPTGLRAGSSRDGFLLSEALRGEGAHLLLEDGARFMLEEHADAELAPRDVVASAIDRRLKAGHVVTLSLSHLDADLIRGRFSNLVAALDGVGFDLTRDPIPVAPAAHYSTGGVRTDLWGGTSLRGLFAAGEVSCTGIHGANRLASNSLLECFVFAHRAAEAIWDQDPVAPVDAAPPDLPRPGRVPNTLPARMWRLCGIERNADDLRTLLSELDDEPPTDTAIVARLIGESALWREESRGAHRRSDFPTEEPAFHRHLVLQRDEVPCFE
jgi:L-aspartate oxidase